MRRRQMPFNGFPAVAGDLLSSREDDGDKAGDAGGIFFSLVVENEIADQNRSLELALTSLLLL